jgi:hypothetical protein
MRVSRSSLHGAIVGIALGSGLVKTSALDAGVTYDLRFSNGTHWMTPLAGHSYVMELWARVDGTDLIRNEGFQSSLTTVVSTQTNGGGITSGGITNVTMASRFTSYVEVEDPSTLLHRLGGANNITLDGITDWGGTGDIQDTNYLFARAVTIQGSSVIILGDRQPVNATTYEYKLAAYTVAVNTAGTGTTSFNVVKPNAIGPGIQATYIVARVDNVIYNVDSESPQRVADTYDRSIGVTFVPEPGFIGAAAIAFMSGRRRLKPQRPPRP